MNSNHESVTAHQDWELKNAELSEVPPHPVLSLGHRQRHFKNLEERIRNSMHIIANLIAAEGKEYLPIFQRLEEELANEIEAKESLKRALFLSKNSNDGLFKPKRNQLPNL